MINEVVLAELAQHRAALEDVRATVERELTTLLAGLDVQFVSSRVKSHDSLRKKIARPDKTYHRLWDVTDLVGLRIATYFEDSIEDVARVIEQTYAVDFTHSADKLRFTDHGKFGYRSLHYVCALRDHGLHEEFRFEIQVRTALQHAWAEIEHDLGYKANESVPEGIRRRFSRVASLLEVADQEFVSIRQELVRHQQAVRDELARPSRPLPLDAVTLATFACGDDVVALDGAIATLLEKPLGEEVYFPEYLVKMLVLAGLGTTLELHEALRRHRDHLPRAVRPYFEVTERLWQQGAASVDVIHRGYSLFFLAHVAIVAGPELGISKVQKLTQLYRALDYPDDDVTAQKLASGLVAALAPALRA